MQEQLGPALADIDDFEGLTPRRAWRLLAGGVDRQRRRAAGTRRAVALQKVTVDPPDPNQSYQAPGIAVILEGALP